MVGGEDDERVVERVLRAQPVDQAADTAVGLRDLGVVGRRRERREIDRLHVVGLMGIEEVHPEEEGLRSRVRPPFLEPRQRAIRRARRRSFADHEQLGLVLGPEIVVVDLEALIEAIAPGQHRRRHERARVIARRLQAFRQRHRLGSERIVAVVAHAVRRRVEARS